MVGITFMDTFEIQDEEVNVEEIMNKIRENIRKRKELGTYPPEIDAAAQQMISHPKKVLGEIANELSDLNINCDIQNNSYVISSHRSFIGKPLIKGREIVHGEVRRYVDPMVFKQITFNQSTAKILNNAAHRIVNIENMIGGIETKERHVPDPKTIRQQFKENDERLFDIEYNLDSLKQQINDEISVNTKLCEMVDQLRDDMNNEISRLKTEMKKENEAMIRSVIASMESDIEKKAWLASILDERNRQGLSQTEKILKPPQDTGVNYFVFEERFRGAREIIAQRQTVFLPYFEGCKNVLDIGCGRGEFLETMRKNGIGARGVDLDETMVDFCRSKGLEVELEDAFDYLEKLEDASLDGVFIDQVVEHLEPAYLVRLLKLCFQKMKYGFYLIAETVNPLSFSSFANFYIDLTHIKPVHPETLRFLLESTGFREVKALFSSPLPETMRLQKLIANEGATDAERYQAEVYNRNIEMLNATLYGAQDYAMIGKK
jgi:2-polyprenyl-3-methyl-5-hydroxy-6-metoxy-1,4-benzoquinol methylase